MDRRPDVDVASSIRADNDHGATHGDLASFVRLWMLVLWPFLGHALNFPSAILVQQLEAATLTAPAVPLCDPTASTGVIIIGKKLGAAEVLAPA